MARTITASQTYARFSLLELQVRSMLREASEIQEDSLRRISMGLADPHYINEIIVRGLYEDGTIGAELRLIIDWRQFAMELKTGGARVNAPSSWQDGVAPSILEGVRTFLLACEEAQLSREFCVRYDPRFDRERVNKYLGFVNVQSRSWARTPNTIPPLGFGPLGEASLVINLAI